MIGRREFFKAALAVTATGLFASEYLVRGRSMVSLAGIDSLDFDAPFERHLLEHKRALESLYWFPRIF